MKAGLRSKSRFFALVGVAETRQGSEGGRRESSLLTFGHTKVRQNKIIPQATIGRPLNEKRLKTSRIFSRKNLQNTFSHKTIPFFKQF